MHEVQTIPLAGPPSGMPNELNFEGTAISPFHPGNYEFLLGHENMILKPLIQNIIDGNFMPEQLPILLYGVPGTGRSHLLTGILETWRKKQKGKTPHRKFRQESHSLTCSDFHRQFTEAIDTKDTESFRKRYRQAKLLLLDDIELLLGKPAAQTELRLLLDEFAGIIVITAQNLPGNITSGKSEPISQDLAERIQSGTTVPIFPPGKAVRARYLRDLASALNIPFTEPLLQSASQHIIGTFPQVYAAVVQKYGEAKSANEPLNLKFWQQFSQEQKPNTRQNLMALAKRTATYFSMKPGDLKGASRCKTVALARSIAVYLAKSQLGLTYKEIGHFFGKRDPSTVRHLFEKVRDALPTDTELRDHLFRLESR